MHYYPIKAKCYLQNLKHVADNCLQTGRLKVIYVTSQLMCQEFGQIYISQNLSFFIIISFKNH